jgi:deoxycytidylate deaminase
MIDRALDRELMKLAVELSRHSLNERDGRVHPFVGAAIVTPTGRVISSGYRG